MTIRRTLVALAAAAGLVLVGAGPAMAGGSPHFIKNATSASIDGVTLVVDFKEAGLESGRRGGDAGTSTPRKDMSIPQIEGTADPERE